MTFSQPIYLLLIIPILAWTVWLGLRMRGSVPARRITAIAVRSAVLLLLVFALAGLQAVRQNHGIATVFVLDRSASMSGSETANAEHFVGKALEAQGPSDESGLIVFGKDPVIDTETGGLKTLDRIYAAPDPSATDIAAAIRLATATMPEGMAKRIVVLSDGNETSGDATDAADAASADGIQIDAAPIFTGERQRSEVLVKNIDGPAEVTKGEPFELRVIAQSTGPSNGVLHVDRNGVPTAAIPVELNKGPNVIAVSQTVEAPGFYRYRATLDVNNDTDPRNNIGMTYVSVRGRPRVLLIEEQPGTAEALETALKPHDIDVVRTDPGGIPTKASDLQSYDALILSDVDAEDITDSQMTMIQSAVRDSGLGFGMIGGDHSFLPGGYYETPIADILPVDLNIRQRKTFPSTCIEIVVDASGSMSMPEDGQEKIKIAGTAAAAMVRMMSPNDLVGVAGSTDDIRFVAPIQRAVNKEEIARECGTLEAGGGGIYIEPSLEFADRTLTPIKTEVRHLILESDGDDAEQQEGSFELARKMVAQGMTISVIAIGDGKDVGFLRSLAAVGKGYYYLASQAKQLQRLVTQDSSIMSRSAIEDGAFLPKVDPTDEVLRGIDLPSMPALYAYDLTSDRPLARTPMRTDKDDPLLAYWQYGLGTSMAFTSDAQPKWARLWMDWPGFNAFWSQAIRATVRQRSSDQIRTDAHLEGGKGVLEISAFDGRGAAINNLSAKVTVIAPDGSTQTVPVEQSGAGHYTGSFDAAQTGGYIITTAQQANGETKPSITRAGFSVAYPPEYQSIGPNVELLAQISKVTGGEMLDNPVQAFRPSKSPGESVKDLWPGLLLAAALLFVVDIAVRRLAIPFGEITAPLFAFLSRLFPGVAAFKAVKPVRPARRLAANGQAARQSVGAPAITKLDPQSDSLKSSNREQGEISESEIEDPGERTAAPRKSRPDSPALNTTKRLLELKRQKKKDE
jgi:Ca-activated chloride channel family protein